MVVNPFFLHGSTQEQNLMQDLVNEQLRMYGLDVYYIPRTFIREASIMREVTSSEFKTYFIIEAYLNNFDGYGGQGDLMSKFGIQVKDEVTLTISRERFENFVAPFINSRLIYQMAAQTDASTLAIAHRPKEGDLIYFPLGRRLFEIKFVEHEQPFYQLGKGYTYELQCELFEYEDEVLNTSIDEIDSRVQNKGYITTLNLVPLSNRAAVKPTTGTGYIKELTIINDGYGFTAPPTIQIDPPAVGTDPNVIALLTPVTNNTDTSGIKNLVVFDSGSGYQSAPNVVAVGDGKNVQITAGIGTNTGIINFEITNQGAGYPEDAKILVYDENNLVVAEGLALTDGEKIVSTIVTNPGDALPEEINAVVAVPASAGEGDYIYNEIIVGKKSGVRARVRGWNAPKFELEITNLEATTNEITFDPGEVIEGETSGARYSVKDFDSSQTNADRYSDNNEIGEEGKEIVDTTEYNQFFNPNEDYFTNDDPFGESF